VQKTPPVPTTETPVGITGGPVFDKELSEILRLREAAQFSEAFALCRKARSTFRDHPDAERLDELFAKLRTERRDAARLDYALESLGAKSRRTAEVALAELSDAGEVGFILLRNVVREGSAKESAAAAGELLEVADIRSLQVVLLWMAKNPDLPEVRELVPQLAPAIEGMGAENKEAVHEICTIILDWLSTEQPLVVSGEAIYGLMRISDRLGPDDILALYRLAKQDSVFRLPQLVELFGELLAKRCEGKKDRFNKMLNDPAAYDFMKSYIEKALLSEDASISAWVGRTGGIFDTFIRGLHGQYYEGLSFDKLVHEQLDKKIQIGRRAFPYPDGRQDNISVRWTGMIRIDKPGKYTFYSVADDGARVWVDNKMIIDDWRPGGPEKSGVIELKKGRYSYKVEFFQAGGGAAISVYWSGPGMEKQLITDDVVITAPF